MQRPVPKKDTAIPPTSEYFFLLYYIMANWLWKQSQLVFWFYEGLISAAHMQWCW